MESQILVSFKSRSPEYAIPETPILVPTKLKRFGLSEIINVCLGNQVKVPFDFLIQNQILKTSIEVYLSNSCLSRETTLEIEYIQSILPPKLNKSITHDDWISSIDSKDELFLTGCYDKLARILDSRGNILSTLSGHSKPIKSVLFLQQDYCLTGGQDSKILLHNLKSSKVESEFAGNASIESLKNLDNLNFVAGDSFGKIQLFSPEIQEFSQTKRSSKKLKLDSVIPVQKSIQEFSLHSGIVSGLEYNQKNNQLFSSGHDHSLRVWDLETASNISSMNAQVPFLSLKLSKDSLILSGHSDNIIRMWDSRSNGNFLN